jgi:cytochrome c oxidase assembly factor CtaG
MESTHAYVTPNSATRTWGKAYKAFLMSRNENLVLKLAPLLMLLGTPEVIACNLIPVVGEIADLSEISLIFLIVVRTLHAVRKYR